VRRKGIKYIMDDKKKQEAIGYKTIKKYKKLHGLSPQANYTD
jgi:hypothetical protein